MFVQIRDVSPAGSVHCVTFTRLPCLTLVSNAMFVKNSACTSDKLGLYERKTLVVQVKKLAVQMTNLDCASEKAGSRKLLARTSEKLGLHK